MDASYLELSLEQQFLLRQSAIDIGLMSEEQAKELLIELMRQLMLKDNAVRYFMKRSLGC